MNIQLLEHKSESYAPRTWHNAAQGITLAVAIDFNTAGERLTTKASGGKIVHYNPAQDTVIVKARELYVLLKKNDCQVVNVAGNGIYTWVKKGFNQEYVNEAVLQILSLVSEHWKLERVVSGGQSGADIAGLIAAEKLGIPSIGMWPKGYKMRFENGVDVNHTKEDIESILRSYL